MSQASTILDNNPGDVFRAALNAALAAMVSRFSGTAAPDDPVMGQGWIDTSASPHPINVYDGVSWLVEGFLDASGHRILPKIGGGKANKASAGTCNLGASAETFLTVTGTTTITSFGSTATEGETKFLTFAAALTLTHHATQLILPTGANIVTAAGDVAVVTALGSGNWQCLHYWPAGGALLAGLPTLASATTTDLGSVSAASIIVSGTTTITGFGSTAKTGSVRYLTFGGALQLTHNGTSMILPGGANITTAAGDTAIVQALGSGNWRMHSFQRAGGMSAFLDAAFSSTQGAVLYRGASGWAALGPGTAGQALQTGGAGANPSWMTVRERLTGSRTYYVRTDGNDSNAGLANNAGGAFRTVQKAIDVIAALDINTQSVTISVASSDATTGVVSVTGPWIGTGTVTMTGDTTTPSNTPLSVTGNNTVTVTGGGRLSIGGFKCSTTTSGSGLFASRGGVINVTGKMEYACATAGLRCDEFGTINHNLADFIVSGGGQFQWYVSKLGLIDVRNRTVTITGTPAFSAAWAYCRGGGYILCGGNTFSGSATGPRYDAAELGIINSQGSGGSYLPGNSAGLGTNPAASPYGYYQ